jgi:hypothetical protein
LSHWSGGPRNRTSGTYSLHTAWNAILSGSGPCPFLVEGWAVLSAQRIWQNADHGPHPWRSPRPDDGRYCTAGNHEGSRQGAPCFQTAVWGWRVWHGHLWPERKLLWDLWNQTQQQTGSLSIPTPRRWG